MDEGYGRFGSYSRVEMERFFHLDDEDRKLIAGRRRDYNRLGYAVQMITVRHLGTFLPDPLNVPAELVEYLAEQLGIEDPAGLKNYTNTSPICWGFHRAVEKNRWARLWCHSVASPAPVSIPHTVRRAGWANNPATIIVNVSYVGAVKHPRKLTSAAASYVCPVDDAAHDRTLTPRTHIRR